VASSVYLIRHGETEWSRTGQHTGRTDIPLTATGEEQARRLRGVLQGIRFALVLVSPMQRARRTCELAGLAPARVDDALHEWDYGEYEGLTSRQIHVQRPGWDVFADGGPGGESPAQVSARADGVLQQIRGVEGNVALVSHGHFLRALGARWCDFPIVSGRRLDLDTAAMSHLGYGDADRAVAAIVRWNFAPDGARDR
jgi:broad specificity phosphatase PhoE